MDYTVKKYPDGVISVSIIDTTLDHFKFRINSYEDLIILVSIAEAYTQRYGSNNLTVKIPCLFGQRGDQRFSPEQSFDLRIITDIINSCNFQRVIVFDPHSTVGPGLIRNCVAESSYAFVLKAVEKIAANDLILVSPDAGAYKKVFKYGTELGMPVVAANKFRDLDGNISLHFIGDVKNKPCLIVDDLCDGGYTFELLGKALREQGASKVYLYVSHGYFSKGFKGLAKYIDGIYCTNSVKDIQQHYHDGESLRPLELEFTQFKII